MTKKQRRALQWAVAHSGLNGVHRSALLELLAAGASEGQEPVAFAVPQEMAGASFIACAIRGGAYTVPLYLNPSAELTALRERIAGMEKDAARYRWMRDAKCDDAVRALFDFEGAIPSMPWRKARHELDAAVDAAIAKQDAKEPK